MKKLFSLFVLVFLFSLYSCTDKVYVLPEPQLEITVIDMNSSAVVSGATVNLFASYEDWVQKSNVLQVLTTDDDGIVLFKELETDKYYFLVEKGTMNNLMDIGATSDILKVGERLQLTVKIDEGIY